MSNKKRKTTSGPHKPRVMVGLPVRVAEALRAEAEPKMQTLAELVRHIAIEWLEKRDKWPPKDSPGKA